MRTEFRKMAGNQRTISNLVRKLDGDNKCNICATNIKDLEGRELLWLNY